MQGLKLPPLPIGLRSRGAGREDRTLLSLFVRQEPSPDDEPRVVWVARFELAFSRFQTERCSRLSHTQMKWLLRRESNPRARAYEARLPPRNAASVHPRRELNPDDELRTLVPGSARTGITTTENFRPPCEESNLDNRFRRPVPASGRSGRVAGGPKAAPSYTTVSRAGIAPAFSA